MERNSSATLWRSRQNIMFYLDTFFLENVFCCIFVFQTAVCMCCLPIYKVTKIQFTCQIGLLFRSRKRCREYLQPCVTWQLEETFLEVFGRKVMGFFLPCFADGCNWRGGLWTGALGGRCVWISRDPYAEAPANLRFRQASRTASRTTQVHSGNVYALVQLLLFSSEHKEVSWGAEIS